MKKLIKIVTETRILNLDKNNHPVIAARTFKFNK
jgi:hypothetical protein